MDSLYYKPSGRISSSFYLFYLIFMVIAIPLVAVCHTYINYFMPFVYFNVLVAAGFGYALGYILSKAIAIGKCRNTAMAGVMSVLSVLIMKYVSWALYIPLVYSNSYEIIEVSIAERFEISWYFLLDPVAVFQNMYEIAQIGVWSLFSITFNGPLLYVVWFLEICVLIFLCAIPARSEAEKPFYEDNNEWFKTSKKEIMLNLPPELEQFKLNIENGNTNEFVDMLNEEFINSESYFIATTSYLDDVDYGYISIEKVSKTIEAKGKEKTSKTDFIEYLQIDDNALQCLKHKYDLDNK